MNGNHPTDIPDVNPEDPATLAVEIRAVAHDYLVLAGLKAQMAISVGLRLLIVAIITALALVSAWLSLIGAFSLGLIRLGLTPEVAMLCLATANLLIASAGWFRIRQLNHWFGWPTDNTRGDS